MQGHILIVEDEVEVANFLNKSGYWVSHFERGDLVEPFIAENNVDLVLLDIMLPGMDGMQVCQMLRAQSDVPIFMLTACSEDSQKLKGLELGADDYICKPFSAPELILRIKNFLNRFAKERPSPGLLLNSNEYNVCYLGQK
jgi:two-component system response regulator BaeR